MIGTSARPFSVNSYSTRGGTSGNVRRVTMPSSSSARSRSESVRGEMPSSERSSSQKRARPSARSRITRSVHLPHTMSAVRQTGQSELATHLFYLNASQTEVRFGQPCAGSGQRDRDVSLLRAPHHGEGEVAALHVEGIEEVVEAGDGPSARRDDQVAALEARRRGQRAALHLAHEQPVALGEADGRAQAPGGTRRGERDAEPRARGRNAARELVDAALQGLVGR